MRYLTKQGVGKINWADFSWNPLGWGCSFGCEYCYARHMANRTLTKCDKCNAFTPHFHPERVDAPLQLKKPSRIFPCDMSDLFGRGIEKDWQYAIFEVMGLTRRHTYLTLTKQGIGSEISLPDNLWFGVSCHSQTMVKEATRILMSANAKHKWVSFEPLMGEIIAPELLGLVDWVVIGALSRGAKKIQPKQSFVSSLLEACDQGRIPVWLKNNLEWIPFREEFPSGGNRERK